MLDLDAVVHRLMQLEEKYFDLQARYQSLIHEHEQLKEQYVKNLQQMQSTKGDDS